MSCQAYVNQDHAKLPDYEKVGINHGYPQCPPRSLTPKGLLDCYQVLCH